MKKIVSFNISERAIIGLKAEAYNANRSMSNIVDNLGIDLYRKNIERSEYIYEKSNEHKGRPQNV